MKMKKKSGIVGILILFGFVSLLAQNTYQQSKYFEPYTVKKFKHSNQKLVFENEDEVIDFAIPFQDSKIVIKTALKVKIKEKKEKYIHYKFYLFDPFNDSYQLISDSFMIAKIKKNIVDSYLIKPKDEFEKKDARKIVGEITGTLLSVVFTGDAPSDYGYTLKVANGYHNSSILLETYYVTFKNETTYQNIKIKNETNSLYAEYKCYKDCKSGSDCFSTVNLPKGYDAYTVSNWSWPDLYLVNISPNGKYVLIGNILFDLQLNTFISIGTPHFIIPDNSWSKFTIFRSAEWKNEYDYQVITVKDEAFKMFNDSIVPLQIVDNNDSFVDSPNNVSVFLDNRNNQKYSSVQIGSQIWMAENLNIGTMIGNKNKQTDNSIIEKYCYDNNEENCLKYGGLYQWNETMDYDALQKGICPDSWHIPSQTDWETLIEYLGGEDIAGKKLKDNNQDNWKAHKKIRFEDVSTNTSGFSALPGGLRGKTKGFAQLYEYSFFRISSNPGSYHMNFAKPWIKRSVPDKTAAFSVRCIKDD